jgi:hypothetical protein
VVTTEQRQPDRQSPEGDQPKKRRTRTPGSRRATGAPQEAQQESSPERQVPTSPAQPQEEEREPAGAGLDLSRLVELQISQAIEPILADFRQHMAQAVQQEMGHALAADGMGPQRGEQPDGESKAAEATLPVVQQREQRTATEGQPTQQPQESQPQPEGGEEKEGMQDHVSRHLRPLPSAVLQGLEQHAAQWLVSMLMAGISAMFAESARAAAQERAEQGLGALLQRTFDPLPESPTKRELQLQVERTLQSILQEVFDAIFADRVRAELQSHGEQATRALVHRDFDAAVKRLRQGLELVLQEIASVLRRQWQRVLRLLLKVILTALEDSLSATEKETLPSAQNVQ